MYNIEKLFLVLKNIIEYFILDFNIFGNYKLGTSIGAGMNGTIVKAFNRNGKLVVLKIAKKNKEMLLSEIAVLKQLQHPNIITLFDSGNFFNKVFMAIEYASSGDLYELIIKEQLEENIAKQYFSQLVSAVKYCHSKKIIHRDIKPENILVFNNNTIKLCDFGLCSTNKIYCKTMCGTLQYVAPEVFYQKEYNGIKSDVWSAAIVLFIMLFRFPPFTVAKSTDRFYDHLIKSDQSDFWKKYDKFLDKPISQEAKDVCYDMLNPNPNKRQSLNDILNYPWLLKA